MKELWINNQLFDLYPEEAKPGYTGPVQPIAITKQANDLRELKNRQADYSNQFKAPATGNNLRITGFADRVSSASINPYTKLPCRLVDNGSEIISNGVAIIEQYAGGDIMLTLYSGIYDFFDTLGEKSIRELDLSDADHVYDLAGVAAGNTSDYYCYPLIQWGGTDKENNIVDIRYQLPAIKFSYVVDKIFEASGYNKGGNVFSLESYLNLYIPVVEDSLIDEDPVLLSQSMEAHLSANVPLTGSGGAFRQLSFTDLASGSAFDSTAGWYSSSRYTARIKTTVNVRVLLNMNTPYTTMSGATTTVAEVILRRNAATIGRYLRQESHGNPIDPATIANIEVDNLTLNPGDYLEVVVRNIGGTTINVLDSSSPPSYSFFSVEAINTMDLGQTISMSSLVPDISQKNILKTIQNIYGLIPQVDHLTRTVNFIQFKTFSGKKDLSPRSYYINSPFGSKKIKITLTAHTDDWSDKLYFNAGNIRDPNNPKINFRFKNYAQKNFMRWIQDDDRAEIGDGILYIDDNTLSDKADLFEMPFAASIQEIYLKGNLGVNIKRFTRVEADPYSATKVYENGDRVLHGGIVYEATDGPHSGSTPDGVPGHWQVLDPQFEKTESVQPRLLLIRNFEAQGSPPTPLDYTDGTDTIQVDDAKIAYFVDPGQAYDLGFTSIIEEHYSELKSVLTKTKIVEAKFKLSENEFKNINFFTPVYVGHFGEYFYINVIPNYITGRLASVELVRL